jgi:hypothetical protein
LLDGRLRSDPSSNWKKDSLMIDQFVKRHVVFAACDIDFAFDRVSIDPPP